jgi:hypothetical protein
MFTFAVFCEPEAAPGGTTSTQDSLMKHVVPTLPVLRTFLLAGFVSLTACNKDNSAASNSSAAAPAQTPAASSDNELKDITKYRLSMDKIDKYIAAQRNIALKAKNLSPAEKAAMEARNDNGDANADASLDDMQKKIDSEPLMKSAIQDAGLSTREFVMITMSMMQSGMAAGVLKLRPKDNQDSLIHAMQASPENVKFYQDNEAEITRKEKDLEAEMKRLGVSNE